MKTNKPLQIFKAGQHTASSGVALTFSESELQASAKAYNPALHEAPLVIGHPKADLPAFGWVQSLSFSDAGLEAMPAQVNADFAEMVNQGAFKKISASFYTPDSPSNPVPGVYYLRHVGFLGAEPPAVKGLRAPEFNESDAGVIEFNELDFNGYNTLSVARIFRHIRDWLIAEKGLDVADKVIADYEIAGIETSAAYEIAEDQIEKTPDLTLSNYNEGDEMSAEDKAKLVALEAENATLKQQQANFAEKQQQDRRAAAHTEHVSFAENLVKAGQLLPAQKDVLIATLDYISAPTETIEFGEGDAKKPLAAALKEALALNPTVVAFGEHAKDDGKNNEAVLADGSLLALKALEFCEAEAAAGRTVNSAEAVAHVKKSLGLS